MSSTVEIPARRRITVREVIGEIFLTVGVILLLFTFYEAFWTNIRSGEMQNEAQQQLDDE